MISTEKKNAVLRTLARFIDANRNEIIASNQLDLRSYSGDDEAMYDRLKVDSAKVDAMIQAIEDCIAVEDPEDRIIYSYSHPNSMKVENRTVALGNILIIYESRPDVTIEAAITAFKAGNKILLKGGKEARNTNLSLMKCWHKALKEHGLDTSWVEYLDLSREETQKLIKDNERDIDLIIPRGGEGLIQFVKSHSVVPVIVSGRGNNFLFVDKDSDFTIAIDLILDGKKRISVCNALDKVLIHRDLQDLDANVERLVVLLREAGIEVLGTAELKEIAEDITTVAGREIWFEEFLAPKIMLALVDGFDHSVDSINTYSGKHSATIVSNNEDRAHRFLQEVDCAAVYHNASTRFTDGGQFGFGAEMAISTQKLHFRGPIGIDQLVTNKWYVFGNGQVRN